MGKITDIAAVSFVVAVLALNGWLLLESRERRIACEAAGGVHVAGGLFGKCLEARELKGPAGG